MFDAVRRGVKTFEVRKDDRAFQTGDTITLVYHDPYGIPGLIPSVKDIDDRAPIDARITFVLRGGQYGIEPGYVVLSLSRIDHAT